MKCHRLSRSSQARPLIERDSPGVDVQNLRQRVPARRSARMQSGILRALEIHLNVAATNDLAGWLLIVTSAGVEIVEALPILPVCRNPNVLEDAPPALPELRRMRSPQRIFGVIAGHLRKRKSGGLLLHGGRN